MKLKILKDIICKVISKVEVTKTSVTLVFTDGSLLVLSQNHFVNPSFKGINGNIADLMDQPLITAVGILEEKQNSFKFGTVNGTVLISWVTSTSTPIKFVDSELYLLTIKKHENLFD